MTGTFIFAIQSRTTLELSNSMGKMVEVSNPLGLPMFIMMISFTKVNHTLIITASFMKISNTFYNYMLSNFTYQQLVNGHAIHETWSQPIHSTRLYFLNTFRIKTCDKETYNINVITGPGGCRSICTGSCD